MQYFVAFLACIPERQPTYIICEKTVTDQICQETCQSQAVCLSRQKPIGLDICPLPPPGRKIVITCVETPIFILLRAAVLLALYGA